MLWHEVNELQNITENVFYKILNNCNLKMNQQDFLNGLADATHGLTCEFLQFRKD